MGIAATLIVRFGVGADSSALVVFEADDLLNVDAAGQPRSQTSPGDIYNFRLQHDPVLRLGSMRATAGQVVTGSFGLRNIEQDLLFAEVHDRHDLSHIPNDGLSVRWFGNEAAGLRRTEMRTVRISGGTLPALGRVSYQAMMRLFNLRTPKVELAEGESWPIIIIATMERAI